MGVLPFLVLVIGPFRPARMVLFSDVGAVRLDDICQVQTGGDPAWSGTLGALRRLPAGEARPHSGVQRARLRRFAAASRVFCAPWTDCGGSRALSLEPP